ncbi:MAG: hypothetical protein MRY32_09300, partial [Rickettsiales bacterium]|nr:hypothetical protein [Rickettsiales bacterium]
MTETFYKIENLQNPQIPRDNEEFEKLMSNEATLEAIRQTQERYLAWQEFRLKSWVPPEKEKIWALIKMQREFNSAKTPIKDKDGSYYTFNPRTHVEFLHLVDLELGGNFMGVSDFSENDRKQIIRRRLIEESIASSR